MHQPKYTAIQESKSVSTVVTELTRENDNIDINPEYQRDVVWGLSMKQGFIDSVYNGIVPNQLIFNLDMSTGTKQCIDGKQRITSLLEYMQNKFPIELNNKLVYFNRVPSKQKGGKVRTMTTREQTV